MLPKQQSGVLAYRHRGGERLEILLVRKPGSKSWGIPKGKLEPHLSLAENAAKEAFEEAGVKGVLWPDAVGSYRALKRVADRKILIEVTVFRMEVKTVARMWPEKASRIVKWCSQSDAAHLLREPLLIQLCKELV